MTTLAGPNSSPLGNVSIAIPSATAAKSHSLGTILIVDDELVTRRILMRQLERTGYRVYECSCGRDAIQRTRDTEIDLVLLDYNMPGLNGLSTLRMIRQCNDALTLPVIMMTASEAREQIVDAYDAGANDYFAKPLDFELAIPRIRAQLGFRNAQKALRASEERYALAAQGTNDGLWDWNLTSGELYLSPRWRAMLGINDPNWQPQASGWTELVHSEDRDRVLADLEAHLCGDTPYFESELRMLGPDRNHRWMLCRGLAVRDDNGLAYRIAGSLTDITDGKVADSLTSLPNRVLFVDRVNRRLEQLVRRSNAHFAILYLDVNDFKLINDTYGHDTGDEFLIQFSRRLESVLREADSILARLGGDEFAILIEHISTAEDAIRVAQRIETALQSPLLVKGRDTIASASIGIAISSQDAESAEELIQRADTAMYHSKRASQNSHEIYCPSMHEERVFHAALATELKQAIRRDELHLVYQPIIDTSHRRTAGFEALLRWNHPIHGPISPVKFIPIAEATGSIIEIGEWVFENACAQAAQWSKEHGVNLMMGINVSMKQLSQPGFAEKVCEILQRSDVLPQTIKVEVTESMLLQNQGTVLKVLEAIRDAGAMIGIDDFGTGYSSLSYLHQIPVHLLKIDRSFVSSIVESKKHLSIVRTICGLAENLGLQTIAEGVETEEQFLLLQGMNVPYVQGFYFSKPVPHREAESLIHRSWT